ncbi:MAG TPA: hypothetical protein ENJ16_05470, partial [Planctomycetaceae bacterium]|nr:hypothetical protein [Planctomycetaceae bacterium]
VGHLFGLKHTDAFGPIGGQPSTNLPYGVYSGLMDKSLSRNEITTGIDQGATGAPYPYTYGFRHSPVLLQPVTQAGNASPNSFLAPGGTVYDNGQAVATFQVDSSGVVQVVPTGNASPIDSATFDASSGVLTLNWNSRPTSSEVVVSYTYDAFRPGYRGPDDAVETPLHVMASPASVGSLVSNTLAQTYLSERSLIKLAFADAGSTQQEADLAQVTAPTSLGGSARDLGGLTPLAVPNLLPPGTVNYGKEFFVEAANVVGSIDLTAAGTSENDVYAFSGDQGEWVTIEVLSTVLAHRLNDDVDAVVSLLDASGNPVDYFGSPARNDDGISSADPILIDVRLPATGTYYIVVDTFASSSVPDTDTGQYELFVYKYTVESSGRQGGTGDTLIGGPGPDVLIGGAGDDIFRGDKQEDAFVGFTAFDISNRPPVAVDDALATDENVTASLNVLANDTDPDAGDDPTTFSLDSIDSVTLSGIGLSNLQTGSVRETSEGVIEFSPGSDFDELPVGATATVTVQYTMSDDEGLSSSALLTITVRGVNDVPTVQNVSGSVEEDGAAVTISFVGDDVDRDDSGSTLAYAFVTTPSEGTVTNNGDGTFKFDPTGGFQDLADGETRTVTFSYQATDRHGGVSNAGTITVTVAGKNDVPAIERLESSAPKPCQASTNGTVTLSGKFLDPDVSNTPKVTVDWGDGSAVETLSNVQNDGTFSATHAYAGAGIYRIQVVVDDQRGGKAEATTKAAVQGVGVVGRTLYVIGTSGRDNVHIRHNVDQDRLIVRAKWNVSSGGNHHDEDDDNNTGTRKTFDARNIRRIAVYGCDGNDEVHLRTVNWTDSNRQPIPARIYGG